MKHGLRWLTADAETSVQLAEAIVTLCSFLSISAGKKLSFSALGSK